MNTQKQIFDLVSLSCSENTTKSYSTSFSFAIKLLKKEYRDAIYSIYGFVRLADEIVDSFHDYDKETLLHELRNDTINALDRNISLNPIINSFQNTIKKYKIEWDLVDSFLESMEYDLSHNSCDDKSYKKYIAGSASAVGLMCLQIFNKENDISYQELKSYAESLGSAFQKVNFLRDMRADYKDLDRVYFPGLHIDTFNNDQKDLIVNDIEQEFTHALLGIKLLNKNAQQGVYLAYKYYVVLFNKIKRADSEYILKNRIRISNFSKLLITISSFIRVKIGVIK